VHLLPPRPAEVASAVANATDKVRRRDLADTSTLPREQLATGTASTLYRYDPHPDVPARGAPVLLVPPWRRRQPASSCAAGARWSSTC
jgi:hypothetical protein